MSDTYEQARYATGEEESLERKYRLEPSAEVLPALGLLLHPVRVLPADASALVEAPPADVVLIDARRELVHAKSICRLLQATGLDCPLVAIVTEGGLAAVNAAKIAGAGRIIAIGNADAASPFASTSFCARSSVDSIA